MHGDLGAVVGCRDDRAGVLAAPGDKAVLGPDVNANTIVTIVASCAAVSACHRWPKRSGQPCPWSQDRPGRARLYLVVAMILVVVKLVHLALGH